jgi:hypothetical protein
MDVIPVLNNMEIHLASEWLADDPARRQCLDVYQALIDLLPRLASLDMNSDRQLQVLMQARNLATRASSHAIRLLQFGRAIELLESGRAVFWAQNLRLRASFDPLDCNIANELHEISRRLEVKAETAIPLDLDDNLTRARVERVMTERHRLNVRFGQLVDRVRTQPGMERFLRNADYASLGSAAMRGPVVILQALWMCVIASPNADPQVIPLHNITNVWLENAARTYHQSASTSRIRLESRGVRKCPMNDYIPAEYDILEELWHRIAEPLLSLLGWTVSELSTLSNYEETKIDFRKCKGERVHGCSFARQGCSRSYQSMLLGSTIYTTAKPRIVCQTTASFHTRLLWELVFPIRGNLWLHPERTSRSSWLLHRYLPTRLHYLLYAKRLLSSRTSSTPTF